MAWEQEIKTAEEVLSGALPIRPVDKGWILRVQRAWDALAKPLDGFGRLEQETARIGGIQKTFPPDLSHAEVLVLASDNGIVAEGVSQSGQEVTALCAGRIAAGCSTLGPLAARTGARILVYDLGICGPTPAGVIPHKIASGTRDFLKAPAMTRKETLAAIGTGICLVRERKQAGATLLGTGEMGIGNTTTSAAILSALLHLSPEETCGRGAGLSDAGLAKKREVVRQGLQRYQSDCSDPLAVLSDLGGFDLAGLAGVCLGGALYHVPILLDGIISQAAALAAWKLNQAALPFWIPSHRSGEPAGKAVLSALSLAPVLDADLRVGEGTGALLVLDLLQSACSVLTSSQDFSDYGLTPYRRPEDAAHA